MSRTEWIVLLVAVVAGAATPLLRHYLPHHDHAAPRHHSVSHLAGQLIGLGFGLGLAALGWPMAFRAERVWAWNERARGKRPWSAMNHTGKPPASINYVRAVGVLLVCASVALLLIAVLDYMGVINAVAD
jgi:hypothetical protein